MEKVTYEIGDDLIETSRIVYVEDAPDVDPWQVLEHQEPKARTKRDDAAGFLLSDRDLSAGELTLDRGEWFPRLPAGGLT